MSLLVGAGGIILSFAKALKSININYQKNLFVEATDISDTCAYMTYIQLSLYGIPAVVYCGNTLTQKMRFKMGTPLYYLQYWKFQKFYEQKDQDKENENKIVIKKTIEKENLLNEVTIKGNSQLSLW